MDPEYMQASQVCDLAWADGRAGIPARHTMIDSFALAREYSYTFADLVASRAVGWTMYPDEHPGYAPAFDAAYAAAMVTAVAYVK